MEKLSRKKEGKERCQMTVNQKKKKEEVKFENKRQDQSIYYMKGRIEYVVQIYKKNIYKKKLVKLKYL